MEPLCRLLADYTEILREVRIGLYRGDVRDVLQSLAVYEKHLIPRSRYDTPRPHPFVVILKSAFDADWVARNVPKELKALDKYPLLLRTGSITQFQLNKAAC